MDNHSSKSFVEHLVEQLFLDHGFLPSFGLNYTKSRKSLAQKLSQFSAFGR